MIIIQEEGGPQFQAVNDMLSFADDLLSNVLSRRRDVVGV